MIKKVLAIKIHVLAIPPPSFSHRRRFSTFISFGPRAQLLAY